MPKAEHLLSVAEARARLLAQFQPLVAETVPLPQALGRVLAEQITARAPVPPFANSSMDGYAVQVADVAGASPERPITLPVSGDIPAGSVSAYTLRAGSAMRIMTGAPLPNGAEAVIPVEDTNEHREALGAPPPAQITFYKSTQLGANTRPVGQDIRAGDVVLEPGAVLRPASLGVLAALGHATVQVHRQPIVAIFSTGDELRTVDEALGPGQIRDVNGYTLTAAIAQCGANVVPLGIARDKVEEVQAKLAQAVAAGAHLIISSAGVSVGAYDVVKAAVEHEGALDFWRVRMRPGKPVAFGQVRGIPFLGLPGNPVSALVTFEVFAQPVIFKLGGQTQWAPAEFQATLAEAITSDGRESYVRVVVTRDGAHRGNRYLAHSTGDQGSAVLTSLVKANALLIIPEGVLEARAGETFTARWLSPPVTGH